MMKKNTNGLRPEFNLFHLAIFGIFMVSLAIRIYGSLSVNITNPEAEILLSVSKIKTYGSATFFYSLMIRIVQFLGFNGDLGLRIINVVMGSLITILPAMFYREIGKHTAIISSLLLSFDPFGIANSVAFSGNIMTVFFLGLLIEAILHNRDHLIYLIILLLIGHGRGLGYFILITLILFAFLFFINRNIIFINVRLMKEKIFKNKKNMVAGSGIILILVLAIIYRVPFSNIATDISDFISGWGNNYQTGNFPIVYPFAIFSYIPLALVFASFFLLSSTNKIYRFNGLSALWLAFSVAIIAFYPRHLILDLVWVSIPLTIFASISIEKILFADVNLIKDDWPFLVIFFSTGINLVLNIISFVYRSIWGLDVTNALLTILVIIIFAVILLLFRAYTSSIQKAMSALLLMVLVFSVFWQISITARTIVMNKTPEKEILWNGYFEGKDIVAEIVSSSKNSLKGTKGKINVLIDGQLRPAEIWALNEENLLFQKSNLISNRPEVILSDTRETGINDDNFQGQEYISDSYPLWTWDPVRSFISTDYWNWFFFRNSLQYREYNYIWTNITMINDKINIGAKN